MQITNTNSQLRIFYPSSLVEYYKYETFKSVTSGLDTKGYYAIINFIANDKNNSLRLYMVDITNQPFWTNDASGVSVAVDQLSSWASAAAISPTAKVPFIGRVSGSADSIGLTVNSISFASVGTDYAYVIVDGNSSKLKPGETVSYDAGAIDNYFEPGLFQYDTTTSGAELLIIYVTF